VRSQADCYQAITVIVPTYNERANVVSLVEAVRAALARTSWDLLFVDDSVDGTDDLIRELAQDDNRIRLIHRDAPSDGLSGAVLEGFASSAGSYCCVIDGDLQHPPELIPVLLDKARREGCDIVVASRYLPGAGTGGLDGPIRQLGSRGLKWLTVALFPRRLAGITDPLSGFFIVRTDVVGSCSLKPVGYKILLEILVRCRWSKADEVPYRFRARTSGESKASAGQLAQFVRHLARLSWDCSPIFAVFHRNKGED
jgi:dolichol-phosphate mannosyltransferase